MWPSTMIIHSEFLLLVRSWRHSEETLTLPPPLEILVSHFDKHYIYFPSFGVIAAILALAYLRFTSVY
jgi:hypothetical protein